MSNYNNLKTTIDASIKQNNNQEITGSVLNSVLNQMVNILGTGYQFAGVATLDPATDPGTPDAKVFYIANGKGTYTNFGGVSVTEDDVVVLYWDSSWHKVSTGIASNEKLSELELINRIFSFNKVEISPSFTENTHINFNGGIVVSGNPMRLTDVISLNAGDVISFYGSTLNQNVSAITLCESDGTPIRMVVQGLASNAKGYFTYIAESDCYVRLSYYIEADIWTMSKTVYTQLIYTNDIYELKNNLDSIVSLESLNWLNINIIVPLQEKIIINEMVKMAYFVPSPGYENHDIAILALSCYSNASSETPIPTRLDLWLTDATNNDETGKQGILEKYTKTTIEDSDLIGYKKVIITATAGTAYILVNWGLVSQYKVNDKYSFVYWGDGWRNKPKLWNVNADDPRIIGFVENDTLSGKNIGVDGDSVTEGNQWSYYASQKLGMSQFNVAVGSACWSYKQYYAIDDSTILTPQNYTDSDFAGFGGASDLTTDINRQKWVNNNACTHIERFIAEVSAGNHPIPDIFVFAMGTNSDTDNGNSNGSVEEAMQAISISDTDFVDTQGKSLKYTMCGAMRWCIETIKRQYPNCCVFVSLPIQRASYSTNKTYLYPKIQLIKEMAIQMGCQIIDQYNGCGITAAIENDSSPYGPYLRDGLHPNKDGQKIMGAFAASQIKTKYFKM